MERPLRRGFLEEGVMQLSLEGQVEGRAHTIRDGEEGALGRDPVGKSVGMGMGVVCPKLQCMWEGCHEVVRLE